MHDATDRDLDAARPLSRVLRSRYVILVLVSAAAAVAAGGRGDWNFFVEAGRDLIHRDGLHFYARHGDVQTGPLSLLAAVVASATPRNGFVLCVVITGALGLASLWMLERTAQSQASDREASDRVGATILVGGIAVVFWWAKLGGYGHLDDAFVITGAVAALWFRQTRRMLLVAMAVGLAIGTKPWAVMFLPLTIGLIGPWRRRLASSAAAVGIAAICWLPFVVYDPGTLRSLRPTVQVAADSVLALLGAVNEPPSWMRIGQLFAALGVALVAVLRRRPEGVLLAAVSVRLVTDPGTWSYYTAGIVLGALTWDVLRCRRIVPLTTLAVSVLMLPSWVVPPPELRAVMRLVACIGAVVLVLVSKPKERPSESAGTDPEFVS